MAQPALVYDPRFHTFESWSSLMCEAYAPQQLQIGVTEENWHRIRGTYLDDVERPGKCFCERHASLRPAGRSTETSNVPGRFETSPEHIGLATEQVSMERRSIRQGDGSKAASDRLRNALPRDANRLLDSPGGLAYNPVAFRVRPCRPGSSVGRAAD